MFSEGLVAAGAGIGLGLFMAGLIMANPWLYIAGIIVFAISML